MNQKKSNERENRVPRENLKIEDILSAIKKCGFKNSTMDSLYQNANDIAEKAILIMKVQDSDYKKIASIMKKYHKAFFADLYDLIKKEESNKISDDNVRGMGELLKTLTVQLMDGYTNVKYGDGSRLNS